MAFVLVAEDDANIADGIVTALVSDGHEAQVARDALLNEVWGVSYFGNTRTLDQHVAQLRKKLDCDPCPIETVHGIGYRYHS